jgi:hypothetical protein
MSAQDVRGVDENCICPVNIRGKHILLYIAFMAMEDRFLRSALQLEAFIVGIYCSCDVFCG